MTPTAPDTHRPELVWHYTDGTGLLAILSGHVLWATSSGFLNDSAEVRMGMELLATEVRARARTEGGLLAELLGRLDEVDPRRPETPPFFILSASASPDSLAMWRTYGRAAESYAIGLDPGVPLSVVGERPEAPVVVRRRRWEPVAYDRGEQERLVRTTLDAIPDRVATLRREHGDLGRESAADLEALAASGPVTGLLDDLERTLLLIKHHGFREEQEVRYAMSLYAGREHRAAVAASGIVQYRTSGYGIAPYVRVTGPDPAGGVVTPAPAPLPIRAVTISPSPHGAAGVESVQELVRAHGYDVPVGKSQIPFRA